MGEYQYIGMVSSGCGAQILLRGKVCKLAKALRKEAPDCLFITYVGFTRFMAGSS